MGKELIRRPLERAELENFYLMTRAYYPGAEFTAETERDGFGWLFGYDTEKHEFAMHSACVMVQGSVDGPMYYVAVRHGRKSHWRRLCKSHSAKRFLTALKKLSEIDWPKLCSKDISVCMADRLSAESLGCHISQGGLND